MCSHILQLTQGAVLSVTPSVGRGRTRTDASAQCCCPRCASCPGVKERHHSVPSCVQALAATYFPPIHSRKGVVLPFVDTLGNTSQLNFGYWDSATRCVLSLALCCPSPAARTVHGRAVCCCCCTALLPCCGSALAEWPVCTAGSTSLRDLARCRSVQPLHTQLQLPHIRH